jgi:succinyl-diaminopimelate desuccinylase
MNIELKYNPAIYLGSNEETGMRDITGVPGNPDAKGFINVCKPPRLSLVPDGSFSIGYGGKGGLTVALRSNAPLRSLIFTAGGEDSPGRATAVLHRRDIPDSLPDCEVARGEATVVSAFSPPRHASNPDPNGNMITKLTSALLDGKLVNEDDTAILEFLKSVSLDIYGTQLGIAAEHGILGKLTVFSKTVDCIDGHVILTLNIRYPLGITYGEIMESIAREAEKASFNVLSASSGTEPYLNDPNSDIANALCTVANEITGENKAPYTISGSTYAHKLPNAYVYGMNGCNPPPDYPKGRGGAHGIDELVSIDRLKRAMRIYARALLTLDVIEW